MIIKEPTLYHNKLVLVPPDGFEPTWTYQGIPIWRHLEFLVDMATPNCCISGPVDWFEMIPAFKVEKFLYSPNMDKQSWIIVWMLSLAAIAHDHDQSGIIIHNLWTRNHNCNVLTSGKETSAWFWTAPGKRRVIQLASRTHRLCHSTTVIWNHTTMAELSCFFLPTAHHWFQLQRIFFRQRTFLTTVCLSSNWALSRPQRLVRGLFSNPP